MSDVISDQDCCSDQNQKKWRTSNRHLSQFWAFYRPEDLSDDKENGLQIHQNEKNITNCSRVTL